MPDPAIVEDRLWVTGANSVTDPVSIGQGGYQWSVNTVNRGGLISSRPGLAIWGERPIDPDSEDVIETFPQGIEVFTPRDKPAQVIQAINGKIWVSRAPYDKFVQIPGLSFRPDKQISFETGIKSVDQAEDGSLKVITAYPVLIIQDGGFTRAAYWDGEKGRHLDPTKSPAANETPPGSWMAWAGSRLWVAQGRKLLASNIGDPLKFSEGDYLAEGGYFNLPSEILGIGRTPDLRLLLVGTESTVTAFQAGITRRDQWSVTPDFQKIITPNIGVVSGRSFVNQFGLTWWYSQGGLVALDNAMQTYRTSKITFRDEEMMRSKSQMSRDLSGVALGTFENYLLVSVPSRDPYNAHTWVLDQSVVSTLTDNAPPAWNGVWTGFCPVQWVTARIDGANRCFCLSIDRTPTGETGFVSNIWEAFQSARFERGRNFFKKRITSCWESKPLAMSDVRKRFRYAEIELTEIKGVVNVEVHFAGLSGSYRKILDTTLNATSGSIGSPNQRIIKDDSVIETYRTQDRIILTAQADNGNDPTDAYIETKNTHNVDRAFSILVIWTGQMTIRAVRIATEPDTQDRAVGKCEAPETKSNMVRQLDGRGIRSDLAPNAATPETSSPRSAFVRVLTPRFVEPVYASLTDEMLAPDEVNTDWDDYLAGILATQIIPAAPVPTYNTWVDPDPPENPTDPVVDPKPPVVIHRDPIDPRPPHFPPYPEP